MKTNSNAIESKLGASAPANQPAEPAGQDADFTNLVNEIYALTTEGDAPEGFDIETACKDSSFIELAQEYGAQAAALIWCAQKRAEEAEQSAMQRVNERMQQRKGLPRQLSGGSTASPRADYANMDSATFRKLSQKLKSSARDGKRVPL